MDDYTVKSVDKAFALLEVVSEYPNGVSITELANHVGMYKSTVHRLLTTMMRHRAIEQDSETGRYKLGYGVLDLGMRLLSSIDLRAEALPYLKELSAQVNEVVHLAFLDQGEVVYIEKVESAQTIRMHSRVGTRVPVHATGLGKAILALLPRPEQVRIIERYGLPRLTEHTVTERESFLRSLETTRETGFAFDFEEHELGVCCVAAPIRDSAGRVVAACSVSGPSIRLDQRRLHNLVQPVKETAAAISARLGYSLVPGRL
ncbi:IclR family transcriptional regulator [Alicyclobacillus sp. ALC3]|uniref:IclR family transcriptional regulator n=1 Tax=Alicyclobacillus sp. ALC3 TaxID=2796143 RepID=UPI0023783700|nr:IclR family transcriptional regulator [Alicyclobacillus sp. ALC3]WDL96135.1 IclR family transcriptional regulator [Alicyclobacillus sp. ALC3]